MTLAVTIPVAKESQSDRKAEVLNRLRLFLLTNTCYTASLDGSVVLFSVWSVCVHGVIVCVCVCVCVCV